MRLKLTIIALVAAIALSLAPRPSAASEDEVATAIKAWTTAYSEHNVERILALYSKDAVLWGTTSPSLRTTPVEIRLFFESSFKVPNIDINFDSQTIRVFGNAAVVAGTYTFLARRGDEARASRARYSFTFVKDGDKWVIVDHHSSLMPQGTRT